MSARLDLLAKHFTQVAGRHPKGAEVSDTAVRAKMKELKAEVEEHIPDLSCPFVVPPVYLEFWRRFGGEKSLTNRMTTLYPPDQLRTSSSHLIFGLHNAADRFFGLDHFVLEDDDPPAMHADREAVETEYDEDNDGDDIWEDFTDLLSDGLLEIAPENLLRSLKRRLSLSDCDTKPFRALLKSLESLYGEDLSEVTAPMLIYFGRGILVSYEHEENAAMIGFSSEERERAFRERFPDAE